MQHHQMGISIEEEGEQELCWLINDLTRIMTNEFNRRLRLQGFELSRSQSRILIRLSRQDGQSQTELAENLGMEKAPLGTIIDKMESACLIERRPDPNDGRRRLVYATEKAIALLPDIDKLTEELAQQALEGLSKVRRMQLSQNLNHMKLNMQRGR